MSEEFTPETLAQQLFTNPPKETNSCQLILDQADSEYIFELLINVLIEGIKVLYGVDASLDQVTDTIYHKLREYFHSIGFNVKLEIIDRLEDQDKLLFTDITAEPYYCEIKKNNFPDYFLEYTREHSGHDKYSNKYKFVLNNKFDIGRKKLSDYYCVYFNGNRDKKFKISFDNI